MYVVLVWYHDYEHFPAETIGPFANIAAANSEMLRAGWKPELTDTSVFPNTGFYIEGNTERARIFLVSPHIKRCSYR